MEARYTVEEAKKKMCPARMGNPSLSFPTCMTRDCMAFEYRGERGDTKDGELKMVEVYHCTYCNGR